MLTRRILQICLESRIEMSGTTERPSELWPWPRDTNTFPFRVSETLWPSSFQSNWMK
jgi:hypothetical protein